MPWPWSRTSSGQRRAGFVVFGHCHGERWTVPSIPTSTLRARVRSWSRGHPRPVTGLEVVADLLEGTADPGKVSGSGPAAVSSSRQAAWLSRALKHAARDLAAHRPACRRPCAERRSRRQAWSGHAPGPGPGTPSPRATTTIAASAATTARTVVRAHRSGRHAAARFRDGCSDAAIASQDPGGTPARRTLVPIRRRERVGHSSP